MRHSRKFFAALLPLFLGASLTQAKTADKPIVKKIDPKLDADLLNASASGDTMAALRALDKGANIETTDGQYGFTPLMWASWHAKLGTMRYLLARGAKVNATSHPIANGVIVLRSDDVIASDTMQTSQNSYTTIGLFPMFRTSNQNIAPLLLAGISGSGMAVQMLLDKGAKVDATTDSSDTALSAAAYAGSLTGIKALLSKGANVNHHNVAQQTPIVGASLRGNNAVVKELLHRGASPAIMIGNFPLFQAIRGLGHEETAKILENAAKNWKPAKVSPPRQPRSNSGDGVQIIHSNGTTEIIQ